MQQYPMKRAFHQLGLSCDGSTGSTPGTSGRLPSRRSLGNSGSIQTKRARHSAMKQYLSVDTPVAGVQEHGTRDNNDVWPSTAQRQLENFKLNTPVLPALTCSTQRESPYQYTCSRLGLSGNSIGADDFKLFSSQSYTRGPSQFAGDGDCAFDHPEPLEPDTLPYTDDVTQTQEQPRDQDASHHDEHIAPGKTPTAGEVPAPAAIAFQPQSSAAMNNALTPELGAGVSELPIDSPMSGDHPRFFDIFKPKEQRKYLCIVRHGESEYNRAVTELKTFSDPLIFDPKLTAKGHTQARNLKSKLAQKIAKYGEPLWVVSPLTRAIQTFMEACPCPDRLQGDAGPSGQAAPPLSIEFLSTISEFVVTAGDVGRPASVLMQEFPQVAQQLAKLPEQWWYQAVDSKPGAKGNCAITNRVDALEPKDHRLKRVGEFSRWLATRQEKFIVLIGHSQFWHYFLNRQHKRMGNCEIINIRW